MTQLEDLLPDHDYGLPDDELDALLAEFDL